MVQPEMWPKPQGTQPQSDGHVPDDDIGLPSMLQPAAWTETPPLAIPYEDCTPQRNAPGRYKHIVWAVGLLVLLGVGACLFQQRSTAREEAHPYWNHMLAATNASTAQGADVFLHENRFGRARVTPFMEITTADADRETTRIVREFVLNNDLVGANAALRAAQRLRVISPDRDVQQEEPALMTNAKMLAAIRDGSANCFHLNVFDCCDEDGDIVRIFINGEAFATIPTSRQGATLSVPLMQGVTSVSLLGIDDGGGGITVMFQTSQGDFFCRTMEVGKEYHMEVVVN